MRRWTSIPAFFAIAAIVAGCTGGGAATGAASSPSVAAPASPAGSAAGSPAGSPASTSEACNPPRQEGVTLTFVSFGGVYQEAQRKAWLEPYTELTGVQFVEDENSSNATIKAQVEAGQVTWDVVDVGNDFGLDAHKDLLEPLDYALIPRDEVNSDWVAERLSRAGHHVRRRARLQHRTDRRRGARRLGGLLRHHEVPRQARRVGLLGGRDVRVRAHGRRRRAGRSLPARPPTGDDEARHDQGRHRVLGVGRRVAGAHRLRRGRDDDDLEWPRLERQEHGPEAGRDRSGTSRSSPPTTSSCRRARRTRTRR